MKNEPNWLELDEYIYPPVIMNKTIRISGPNMDIPFEITASLIYNTYQREIDLTDSMTGIVT